ncbi:hypothetical protein ABWK24_20870 [Priestia megaterium]|jgi:methyl-accepting chemotaxis protein|uniref:hypothetical protein n=1 Tax=Priestia megaterium TaxID=1404 RepID=UPI0033919F33
MKAEEYISEKGKCYGGITKSEYLSKAASHELLVMVIISTISLIAVAVISYFYTQRIADSSESTMTACSQSGS